jgi:hypothetical protein
MRITATVHTWWTYVGIAAARYRPRPPAATGPLLPPHATAIGLKSSTPQATLQFHVTKRAEKVEATGMAPALASVGKRRSNGDEY